MASLLAAAGALFVLTLPPGAIGIGTAFGALSLDGATFDKVRQLPGKTMLVKVDKAFAFGELEEAFKDLCKRARHVKDLIVAEVAVQDGGDEPENAEIANRYSVKESDYPAYLLFQAGEEAPLRFKGFADPSAQKPFDWDDEEDGEWEPPMMSAKTADNVAQWLRMQGVRMPATGTILELDDAVKVFLEGGHKDSDLEAAKKVAEDYATDTKAPIYIRTMEKVKSKGAGYVETEMARVKKLLAGKITPKKRGELQEKMGILNVFAVAAKNS